MLRYHATTPTHRRFDAKGEPLVEFKGKTCGVKFEDGEAYFDDISLPKNLGRTAEEVAREMMTDFGYEVEVIDENGTHMPFDPMAVHPARPVDVAPKPRKVKV